MATYLPSHKPSKWDEQDMLEMQGQTHKLSNKHGHMDTLVLADQQKLTFIICADTGYCLQDLNGWLSGQDGKIEWRESVLSAIFDDDDDDDD